MSVVGLGVVFFLEEVSCRQPFKYLPINSKCQCNFNFEGQSLI